MNTDVDTLRAAIKASLRVRYPDAIGFGVYAMQFDPCHEWWRGVLCISHTIQNDTDTHGPRADTEHEALVALATMLGLAPDGTDPVAALRAFAIDHAKRCGVCDDIATRQYTHGSGQTAYACDRKACVTEAWVECTSCGCGVSPRTGRCTCGGTGRVDKSHTYETRDLPHAALLRTLPRRGP